MHIADAMMIAVFVKVVITTADWAYVYTVIFEEFKACDCDMLSSNHDLIIN